MKQTRMTKRTWRIIQISSGLVVALGLLFAGYILVKYPRSAPSAPPETSTVMPAATHADTLPSPTPVLPLADQSPLIDRSPLIDISPLATLPAPTVIPTISPTAAPIIEPPQPTDTPALADTPEPARPTDTPALTDTPEPARPTDTPTLPAEADTPSPTPTLEIEPACDCSGDLYDCSDFALPKEAQSCYELCKALGKGDVHHFDKDGDGTVCEED
jgi:hypothetical protein